MAVATWIESVRGTDFIEQGVYKTNWFTSCWILLSIFSLVIIIRRRLWKRKIVFSLHLSFLIILIGALTTHLTSKQGIVHLRQMVPTNVYKVDANGKGMSKKSALMPFTLTMRSFQIVTYPGTEAPQDYVTRFDCLDGKHEEILHGQVSMNVIFRYKGYRLYQTSYDPDFKGSWLAVNYDPYGTPITYVGYAMLALSMIIFLMTGAGHFKRLLRSDCLSRRHIMLFFVVSCFPISSFAKGNNSELPISVIERAQADKMKTQQVVYNNRVVPVNTMAIDFVLKITGKKSFRGLTPEQVMFSWMLYPNQWQYVPMIRLKTEQLCKKLGATGPYVRFVDFFDAKGEYKLNKWLNEENGKHSSFASDVEQADEKVGIILMLSKGELGRPVKKEHRLSDEKVKAEIFYNEWPVCDVLYMFNLTMGILIFVIYILRLLGLRNTKSLFSVIRSAKLWHVFEVMLGLSFILLLGNFVIRWYIAGSIPLSNGYETMQFMALISTAFALILNRRLQITLPIGFCLSGILLLVSHIGLQNPQITPLMPVLHSPWLSSHVSCIMMSYSLYAFMLFVSATSLVLDMRGRYRKQVESLTIISRILLYPATFLLAIGIFLGAIWANVSWGSYWSWDPKEVWALITMLVYGFAFHTESLTIFTSDKLFNAYIVFSFLTILMTYFGVNYLLGGMHSYAG